MIIFKASIKMLPQSQQPAASEYSQPLPSQSSGSEYSQPQSSQSLANACAPSQDLISCDIAQPHESTSRSVLNGQASSSYPSVSNTSPSTERSNNCSQDKANSSLTSRTPPFEVSSMPPCVHKSALQCST